MSQGVIEQVGDGNTIYNRPESAFVASFVGENNLFSGAVAEAGEEYVTVDTPAGRLRARHARRNGKGQLAAGEPAFVFVRPESLKFAGAAASSESARPLGNRISARIHQQEFEGNLWQVFCGVEGSDKPVKLSMVNDGESIGHAPGEEVTLGFNADLTVALPQGELAAE
ncbi:MAG: TOBE domain-containing protein [Gammaproteobacteria bacterium]|nr:TOBE domain-containing protein [Gammaproteobacteria bacterium]